MATQSYQLLVETYGEDAVAQITWERWFKYFKRDDFDAKDKE